MHRFLFCLLIALPLASQTPAQNTPKPTPKAPKEVDDALRARIKQFYDYHVQGKYRLAEPLVAEESKDDFYALAKPDLHSFQIANIEYTDNFTKAKVTILGAMPVSFPMAGMKVMDVPFASYWEIQNGVWCYYFNKVAARQTPFGELKEAPKEYKAGTAPSISVPASPEEASRMIAQLQSALKVDHTHVDLAPGKSETVKVTNTLPGPVSLSVDCPDRPLAKTGITATFDKKNLKGNDSATLTFTADASTPAGLIPIIINVDPTRQVLSLMIAVKR